jgi:hypothetical protein
LVVVVTGLHGVAMAAFQEVAITYPRRSKSKIIRYKTNMIVDKAYLESMVLSMVSYLTPYNTKSFAK